MVNHVIGLLIICGRFYPPRINRNSPDTWDGYIQDCCNTLPIYQRKGLLRFKDKNGFRNVPAVSEEIYGNSRLQDIFGSLLEMPIHRIWVRGLHPIFPMPDKVSINEALGNRLSAVLKVPKLASFKIPRPPQLPIAPHLDVHAMDVGAIVYLNDVDASGGALGVWPGSHRLFSLAFNSEIEWNPTPFYKRAHKLLRGYKPTMLGGKRGDLIIFHNRLLHTNTLNETTFVRHAVLIDVLGENWKCRNNKTPKKLMDERNRLGIVNDAKKHEIAQEIIANYKIDPMGAFLTKHPRVSAILNRISQDPLGAQRRSISRKVRERKEGDIWIVISPVSKWQNSPKIDAYGDPKGASFVVDLNGCRVGRSEEGIMIESLDVKPGLNYLRISGSSKNVLYIKVVATSNPLNKSPILLRSSMDKGFKEFEVNFFVPSELILEGEDKNVNK